jgi:hypothetical protein
MPGCGAGRVGEDGGAEPARQPLLREHGQDKLPLRRLGLHALPARQAANLEAEVGGMRGKLSSLRAEAANAGAALSSAQQALAASEAALASTSGRLGDAEKQRSALMRDMQARAGKREGGSYGWVAGL